MSYLCFNRLIDARKSSFKVKISWYSILATFFFIGKIPKAPGTFASLAVYPIYYYIMIHSSSYYEIRTNIALLLAFLLIFGFFAIEKFQDETNTYDHNYVVVDEVIGQLLTIYITLDWVFFISAFLNIEIPNNVIAFAIVFIAFRCFDIFKPYFIGYVNDRYKGGFGVILDDVLASFFASGSIYISYVALKFLYYYM